MVGQGHACLEGLGDSRVKLRAKEAGKERERGACQQAVRERIVRREDRRRTVYSIDMDDKYGWIKLNLSQHIRHQFLSHSRTSTPNSSASARHVSRTS
jgi:hypothetical protein